jgi:hypothetical protein
VHLELVRERFELPSGSGSISAKMSTPSSVDHLPDLLERDRGDVVDQLAELFDVDVREQVGARGQKLPELDAGRAELLERVAELDGALPGRRPLADDADLTEDAQEARTPGDARDLQRASSVVCGRP